MIIEARLFHFSLQKFKSVSKLSLFNRSFSSKRLLQSSFLSSSRFNSPSRISFPSHNSIRSISTKLFHMSATSSSSLALGKPDESATYFSSSRDFTSSEWQKVGPGFWTLRTSLSFLIGIIDVGTQMSLIEVKPDEFILLSTVKMTPTALATLKEVTDDGKKIVAAIGTHPFHTLFFVDFKKEFPSVPIYGTARHKRVLNTLQWEEEAVSADSPLLKTWESSGVFMRVPEGAPFDDPPEGNHFSGLFVYHHPSRALHIDDTILYFPHGGVEGAEGKTCLCSSDSSVSSPKEEEKKTLPPITNAPMCLALRLIKKKGSVEFWNLKKGLYQHAGSAAQFRSFMENLLNDFPFDSLVAAHVGIKQGGAHKLVSDMLKKISPVFDRLDARFKSSASSNEAEKKPEVEEKNEKAEDKENVEESKEKSEEIAEKVENK